MSPAARCGGCQGLGAHRRWCAAVVGTFAAHRGAMATQAEALGDGCNVPEAANHLWLAAAILTREAERLAEQWQARNPTAPGRDEARPDLYAVALAVTDEVLGEGAYAEANAGHPDPGVRAAIEAAALAAVPDLPARAGCTASDSELATCTEGGPCACDGRA